MWYEGWCISNINIFWQRYLHFPLECHAFSIVDRLPNIVFHIFGSLSTNFLSAVILHKKKYFIERKLIIYAGIIIYTYAHNHTNTKARHIARELFAAWLIWRQIFERRKRVHILRHCIFSMAVIWLRPLMRVNRPRWCAFKEFRAISNNEKLNWLSESIDNRVSSFRTNGRYFPFEVRMSVKRYIHPRNKYKRPPDYKQLAVMYPEFREIAIMVRYSPAIYKLQYNKLHLPNYIT